MKDEFKAIAKKLMFSCSCECETDYKDVAIALRTQYFAGLERTIEIVENLCGSCPGELTGGTCQFSDAIRQEIERFKVKP